MSEEHRACTVARVLGRGDRHRAGIIRRVVAPLVAAVALLAVAPSWADYRVDAGDVIEIFVTRQPDLQRRVSVKMDGTISFPLLGTTAVAGLSPAQLQEKIKAALVKKVLQQRATDGREFGGPIDPDEITVSIVEYRPIYVTGDVAKPGEYAYRPMMTARQAIAMSGGYDLLRARGGNPAIERADLRSEFETLWLETATAQVRLWRIRTELGEKDNASQDSLTDVPLARSVIARIIELETESLATRQADFQKQQAFLQRTIKQGNEQIALLSDQQQKEEQGVREDAEELKKDVELYGKGALPSPRVTDARRAVLLSSTRKLQTTAQLMQTKRQQDDYLRQLEKLYDQHKLELLGDLQETVGKIGILRSKLQAVEAKLGIATAKLRTAQDDVGETTITLIRKDGKQRQEIAADEDSELQPGDVLEIALPRNRLFGPFPTASVPAPAAAAPLPHSSADISAAGLLARSKPSDAASGAASGVRAGGPALPAAR